MVDTTYVPPISPEVNFVFKGTPSSSYVPPVSPEVNFIFGADSEDPTLQAANNFMIFLTM